MNEKIDKAEASLKSAVKMDDVRLTISIPLVNRELAGEIVRSVTSIIGISSYSVYVDPPEDTEDE